MLTHAFCERRRCELFGIFIRIRVTAGIAMDALHPLAVTDVQTSWQRNHHSVGWDSSMRLERVIVVSPFSLVESQISSNCPSAVSSLCVVWLNFPRLLSRQHCNLIANWFCAVSSSSLILDCWIKVIRQRQCVSVRFSFVFLGGLAV